MGIRRLFTEHPASVGETYLQHLGKACGFAVRMVGAGLACFLHALFPFAFQHTGSDCIERLHDEMMRRRRSGASVAALQVTRASAAR
jgi:hypothetical protein